MSCFGRFIKNNSWFSGDGGNVLEEPVNLSNWMGEMEDKIRTKALNRITIPGSHNAGKFNICKSTNINKKQIYFSRQLRAGVRYFDIKVYCDGGSSSGLDVELEEGDFFDGLLELIKFAEGHRKEILMVDLNFDGEISREVHRIIVDKIIVLSGDLLVNNEVLSPTSEVSEFIDSGQNLIIIYRLAAWINPFWSDEACNISFMSDEKNAEMVVAKIDELAINRNRNDSGLFLVQAVLNSRCSRKCCVGFGSGFCFGKESAIVKLNRLLMERFENHWHCNLNIICVDFVEYPHLVEAIIYQNYEC